jgi:hypothetical protein
MPKQKFKAELLNDIQVERKRLEGNLDNLTEMEMTQGGVIVDWSIKDVLAHLVAWEQQLLSWYESGLRGTIPETTPVGMGRKAIDALNQKIFAQYRQWPMNEVLVEFHSSYKQVLAVVREIPEDDLFTIGRYAWTGKLALVDYIVGNTCNHYHWANAQVRRWLKTKNGG